MVLASGSAFGAADRLDRWRDLVRANFVALDVAADADDGFVGEVRSSTIAHLQVSDVRSVGQACRRTGQLARGDSESYLQVGLITRGAAVLQQDGRECVLGPGDFAVYETDRPFLWGLRDEWQLFVYTWPRHTVPVGLGETRAITAQTLSGSGGLSGIVGRMLRELVTDTPDLSSPVAARLADEVSELVTTVAMERCLQHEHCRGQDDLQQRIHRYVEEHLADPALDPSSVASAHFISTRQLHRIFAGQGRTVSQLIRERRLERCRRELHRTDSAVPITEIAHRWGFGDAATFSRAFRAAYGISPSAYRAGERAAFRAGSDHRSVGSRDRNLRHRTGHRSPSPPPRLAPPR